MKHRLLAASLIVAAFACAQPRDFESRKQTVIQQWAHPQGTGEPGYGTIAARLYKKEDPQWCSRRLQ